MCMCVSQGMGKERVRRRRREREEERERNERAAELWLQKNRQEKLKEETVMYYLTKST